MSGDRASARVRQLLDRLAEHLDRHAQGDPLAVDALVDELLDPARSSDDLAAVAWVLRALARTTWESAGWSGAPAVPDLLESGPDAPRGVRVSSDEEREALAPDAWGYLLDLLRRGTLGPAQFERVVERLAGCDEQPVSVATAREAAASVVLDLDEETPEGLYGDLGVPN